MATTNIKKVNNRTSRPVAINNIEKSTALTVLPNERVDFDYNVPWARSKSEFDEHRIELAIPAGTNPYHIWQHWDDDGDYVRCSTDGGFHSTSHDGKTAARIAGISDVGGVMELVIETESSYAPNGFLLVPYSSDYGGVPAFIRFPG